MDFKATVLAMSGKEVVMSMVNGLRKPRLKVDMGTFGTVKDQSKSKSIKKNVCYGCAATNTICEIANVTLDETNVFSTYLRATAVNSNAYFMARFENAINELRKGNVSDYNTTAKDLGMAILSRSSIPLPRLINSYSSAQLDAYEAFANEQEIQSPVGKDANIYLSGSLFGTVGRIIIAETWSPTVKMRQISKATGKKVSANTINLILQQTWISSKGNEEWRDVPIEVVE
jgi:hypothetical protein